MPLKIWLLIGNTVPCHLPRDKKARHGTNCNMANTTSSLEKIHIERWFAQQCINQHPVSSLIIVRNIYLTKKTTLSNRRLTILISKHRTIITKYYDSCWWQQNFLVFYSADWKIISASSCKNSQNLGINTFNSWFELRMSTNSKKIYNWPIIQLCAVSYKYLQR